MLSVKHYIYTVAVLQVDIHVQIQIIHVSTDSLSDKLDNQPVKMLIFYFHKMLTLMYVLFAHNSNLLYVVRLIIILILYAHYCFISRHYIFSFFSLCANFYSIQ